MCTPMCDLYFGPTNSIIYVNAIENAPWANFFVDSNKNKFFAINYNLLLLLLCLVFVTTTIITNVLLLYLVVRTMLA